MPRPVELVLKTVLSMADVSGFRDVASTEMKTRPTNEHVPPRAIVGGQPSALHSPDPRCQIEHKFLLLDSGEVWGLFKWINFLLEQLFTIQRTKFLNNKPDNIQIKENICRNFTKWHTDRLTLQRLNICISGSERSETFRYENNSNLHARTRKF